MYRPPNRPLGSLKPTQPGRVTNPTQGHPGPPWVAPLRQSAGRSGVSPSHRPSTGSCHCARSGSTAGPGQWLPPCMHSRGTRRQLWSTSLKHARAIWARAVTSVVVDDSDVEWQPCHCGRGSGHEQPGECSGDSHDGGWPWGAPPGRVAWSRLDAHTGLGTVLFGSGLNPRSSGARPALVSQSLARRQVVRVLRAS